MARTISDRGTGDYVVSKKIILFKGGLQLAGALLLGQTRTKSLCSCMSDSILPLHSCDGIYRKAGLARTMIIGEPGVNGWHGRDDERHCEQLDKETGQIIGNEDEPRIGFAT